MNILLGGINKFREESLFIVRVRESDTSAAMTY